MLNALQYLTKSFTQVKVKALPMIKQSTESWGRLLCANYIFKQE